MTKSASHLAVFLVLGLGSALLGNACQTPRSVGPEGASSASAANVSPATPATPPAPQSAAATVALPETPVGHVFSAWLAAFNAADRGQLEAVLKQFREVRPVESVLGFRQMTGGFDVKKVLEASPTRLRVWLRERASERMAEAQMEVAAQSPPEVVGWGVRAIPTPDEFMTAEQRGRMTIDASKRSRVIDGIARAIDAHYVYPEVGTKMIAALRDHAVRGDYDKIVRADALGAAFTRDLREVSHDLHVRVEAGPTPPPMQGPREDGVAFLRGMNFGFGHIARLPDNVAHLVIHGFVPAENDEVRKAIGGLMSQVADADALLVDLRENHGGAPATVALIASYFFDPTPVHLNDMYRRSDDSTKQFWTSRALAGKRFGGKKPLYVLTSKKTFSGGEELAYDLQTQRRGLVVGETTGGGAHPIAPHDVGDGFMIAVPWGRPINPVTKKNWERVGVVPDITVPAEAALEEARRRAVADVKGKGKGKGKDRKARSSRAYQGEAPAARPTARPS